MADALQSCGSYVLGPRLATSARADLFVARTAADGEFCYVVKVLRQIRTDALPALRDRVVRLGEPHACPQLAIPVEVAEQRGAVYLVRAAPPAIDLARLLAELRQRKVGLPFEVALGVVLDVLAALAGLHACADAAGAPLLHGEVNASHVLITEAGGAVLIGAELPRSSGLAARRLDVAGAVALLYEVLSASSARPLPAAQQEQQRALRARFEPIVVRGLGMAGDDVVSSSAAALGEALAAELAAAGARVDRQPLVELMRRLGLAQPPARPPAHTVAAVRHVPTVKPSQPAPIDFGELQTVPALRAQPDVRRAQAGGKSGATFAASSPRTIDDSAEITEPFRPAYPLPATEPMLPVVAARPSSTPASAVAAEDPGASPPAAAAARHEAPDVTPAAPAPAARTHLASVALKRVVVVRDRSSGPAAEPATPSPHAAVAAPGSAPATTSATPPATRAAPATKLATPAATSAAPTTTSAPPTTTSAPPPATGAAPAARAAPPAAPIIPPPPERRRLGEILVAMGAVSEAAVQAALAVQPQQGGRLGEILGRMGSLDDTRLAEALARQAGLPTISPDELAGLQVPLKLLNALPEAYASAKRILPIAHDAVARCVTLAAADPHDRTTINEARILIAAPAVEVRVAPRGSLEETIRRVYASRGVETVGEGGALLLLATASQNVADSLKVRLVAEGFTVRHVVDGQLAREALEQGGVSGLVCELSLPKVDGYNLLLTARSRDAYRDLPIFVFSSRADDYHMSKALELGADDFLPMPLNLDFLVSKLRRSVVKRPAADASAALAPPAGGVAGSLAEMSLTEIVQTLELGRKTATVAIQFTGGVSGVIGFVSGQVTYAKADDQVGEPAFYVLAAPHEGSFQIRYGEVQAEKNIDNSTTFLLLEAMRRTDERR